MTTVLNPIITEAGLQAVFNAQNSGLELQLTHIAFGGGAYEPVGNETALMNELKRVAIAGGARITPSQIRVSAIWEDAIVEAAIQEVGFYAGAVLFAILSRAIGGPYVYKTKDSGLVFSYDWKLSSVPAGSVTVVIDPDQGAMLSLLAQHETNLDAHPQYLLASTLADQFGVSRFFLDGTPYVLPAVTGLSVGYRERLSKQPSVEKVQVSVNGSAGEVITYKSKSDTSFWLDINAEVIVVWNGAGWEV